MGVGKTLALAAILAGGATAASAELRICNETSAKQGVSIGYKDSNNWVSEGWWNVDPGSCATVVAGDLQTRYYYYRAEIDGGDFNGQDYMFCTSTKEYTIVGDENCQSRGYDRENFAQIDTGETAKSYTLTLNR